jgi:hypothetical protein
VKLEVSVVASAAWPPFPSAPCSRTVLTVKGPLRRIFSDPQKILLRRAVTRAPLTAPVRSEDRPMRRERGQMQRPNRLQFRLPRASRWSAPAD